MLENEGLENAIWTAGIHYNTDNIHIHIATCEIMPAREKIKCKQYKKNEKGKFIKKKNEITGKYEKIPILDENGNQIEKEEYKGYFKAGSIRKLKQTIVSEFETDKSVNIEITNILRGIVNDKKERTLSEDPDFAIGLLDIYGKLKEKEITQKVYRNNWVYNRNALSDIKPHIDDLSYKYISKYHSKEYKTLEVKLEAKEEGYRIIYGGNNDFKNDKIGELYERLGNAILKELRDYDRNIESSKEYYKNNGNALAEKEFISNTDFYKSKRDLRTASWYLRKSMRDEVSKFINKAEFDLLQKEIDQRGTEI